MRLHIERLVLEGVADAAPDLTAIAAAVQCELAAIVAVEPPALTRGFSMHAAKGDAVLGTGSDAMASAIARSVHGQLGPAGAKTRQPGGLRS